MRSSRAAAAPVLVSVLFSVLFCGLLICAPQAQAFTVNTTPLSSREKAIEHLGTGIAIALPLVAGGIAYYKKDDTGIAQLLVESVLTVGTAYGLKSIVKERRPDGSDYKSFPSETTAAAASGSSFLWRRYGWEYGLPAFAMTQFVSYSRVQARQHRWYDTLASSGIAAGYAWAVGTRYRGRYNMETSIDAAPDGAMIHLSYAW